MGMFDGLRVQVILPDRRELTDEVFQTKSLDNEMATYIITHNRELCKEVWAHRYVEDSNHMLGGYFERVPYSYKREFLTDYNGTIIFYGDWSPEDSWREYFARFESGILKELWYEDTKIEQL